MPKNVTNVSFLTINLEKLKWMQSVAKCTFQSIAGFQFKWNRGTIFSVLVSSFVSCNLCSCQREGTAPIMRVTAFELMKHNGYGRISLWAFSRILRRFSSSVIQNKWMDWCRSTLQQVSICTFFEYCTKRTEKRVLLFFWVILENNKQIIIVNVSNTRFFMFSRFSLSRHHRGQPILYKSSTCTCTGI